jgi:hypothetical protein
MVTAGAVLFIKHEASLKQLQKLKVKEDTPKPTSLACLNAVAVGTADFALSNFGFYSRPGVALSYHSRNITCFCTMYMIKFEDPDIYLSAVNAWMARQISSNFSLIVFDNLRIACVDTSHICLFILLIMLLACLSHANLTSCVPYATAFVLPIEIFLGVSILATTRADLFHAQTILAEGTNDCARQARYCLLGVSPADLLEVIDNER